MVLSRLGLVAQGHTRTWRAQPGPDLLEPPVVLVGVQPDPPVLLLAPGELQDQSRDVSAWRALCISLGTAMATWSMGQDSGGCAAPLQLALLWECPVVASCW